MDRKIQKLSVFINFAKEVATLSTCKRAQVGCIIFPADMSGIYEIGFNGPPVGADNNSCRAEPGNCGCSHAEANAVAKLDSRRVRDAVMYCTTMPCEMCACLIANSKAIKVVLYESPYRNDFGLQVLKQAKIISGKIGLENGVVTDPWFLEFI